MINVISSKNDPLDQVEFVERKGLGHPDTLADNLAEALSRNYSLYTLKRFGAVLHHNFDKTGILGGKSSVVFGKGRLISPIRVLVNGRVSESFSREKLPYKRIINTTVINFFKKMFGKMVCREDLDIHYNLSSASSPGHTNEKGAERGARKYWFEPRNLNDLPELRELVSNDTSLGCAYAPLSKLENLVLKVEKTLNSYLFKKDNPWCGSDIKIMANRVGNDISMTMCIPQIASYVKNLSEYKRNLSEVRKYIDGMVKKEFQSENCSLFLNTRDNYENNELYLTAIGSSVESGDEGLVGRGNRVNGLISSTRPISMEGASGKNPVYHVGKLYNLCALNIARKIYDFTGIYTEVYLVSQSGQSLLRPWKVVVKLNAGKFPKNMLESLIIKELDSIPKITKALLDGRVSIG